MKKLKNIVPTFAEKIYPILSEKVEKCCSNIQHFLKILKNDGPTFPKKCWFLK
jgi:hypothetical protein